jgi:hypothetical protein
MTYSRYSSKILVEGLKKATKNCTQYNRRSVRDSNPVPPEYKSRALLHQPARQKVISVYFVRVSLSCRTEIIIVRLRSTEFCGYPDDDDVTVTLKLCFVWYTNPKRMPTRENELVPDGEIHEANLSFSLPHIYPPPSPPRIVFLFRNAGNRYMHISFCREASFLRSQETLEKCSYHVQYIKYLT